MKTCTSCERPQPLSEFGKRSASPDGLAYKCKTCVSEYNRRYRDENQEKLVQYARDWYAGPGREHIAKYNEENREKRAAYYKEWTSSNRDKRRATEQKRRAAKSGSGGSFTEAEWRERLSEFDGLCAYCGEQAEHIDHLIPVSLGGPSYIWNLIPACSSCNHSKKNRTLDEWRGGQYKHLIPKEWTVND